MAGAGCRLRVCAPQAMRKSLPDLTPAAPVPPAAGIAQALNPELTIVILCRDEARAIARCVGEARGFLERRGIRGEVVVVDNGSGDDSAALARAAGARVVCEPQAGYGNAIMAGIDAARGRYIILGDGDGEHNLDALDQFEAKLRDGFDLVVGNRFQGGTAPGASTLLRRYVGAPLLSGVGRLLFRAPISDFHCGLRGFNAAAVRSLGLQCPGMELASEMIVKAVHKNLSIAEAPVAQRRAFDPDRTPHLRTWSDGWRHLRLLLMLSPKWLFLYPAWLLLAAGVLAMVAPFVDPTEQGGLFGAYTMLFGAAFFILGAQLIGFYLSARAFYESAGLIAGGLRARLRRYHLLEICLSAGVVLGAAGAGAAAGSLFIWAGGGELELRLRLLIAGVTMMILGGQVIFHGFLISALALQEARR